LSGFGQRRRRVVRDSVVSLEGLEVLSVIVVVRWHLQLIRVHHCDCIALLDHHILKLLPKLSYLLKRFCSLLGLLVLQKGQLHDHLIGEGVLHKLVVDLRRVHIDQVRMQAIVSVLRLGQLLPETLLEVALKRLSVVHEENDLQ